jgi:hypothetical protein
MRLIYALVLSCLMTTLLYGAMSDSKAATEAFKLWGPISYIGHGRQWGDSNWTKQIGFLSPGCREEVTILGKGYNTWDAAFAALPVDKGITGPFAGKASLQLYAPVDYESGVITGVQWFVNNVQTGPLFEITTAGPVWVIYNWDISTVSDGLYVVCAAMFHIDCNYGMSNASLVRIKNAA